MTQIIPLARSRHGNAKGQETDAATWERELTSFKERTRLEAANLAAHSWDVTLVGERLLISCAWYPARSLFWYAKDGTKTPLTEEEFDRLYSVTDMDRFKARATRNDGKWRLLTINTEHLA